MCRSIKTLRPPYVEAAGNDDVRAAATQELLDRLEVRASSSTGSVAS